MGTNSNNQTISLLDMMPGVALVKAAVQTLMGDWDGAIQTTMNFLNDGLGTSQLRSGYFLLTGRPKKAVKIQLKFLKNLMSVADNLKVMGHRKHGNRLINYELWQIWESIKAFLSIVGTVIGAVFGGPVSAITYYFFIDLMISFADTAITNVEEEVYNFIECLCNMEEMKPDEQFDATTSPVLDAAVAKTDTKVTDIEITDMKVTAPQSDKDNYVRHLQVSNENIQEKIGKGAVVMSELPNDAKPVDQLRVQIPKKACKFESNDLINRIKVIKFKKFLETEKDYVNLSSHNKWSKLTLDIMYKFTQNKVINEMQVEKYTKKLKYLSEEHTSLIQGTDFRWVNTVPLEPNCLLSSVCGILGIDVLTLMMMFEFLPSCACTAYSKMSVIYLLNLCKSKKLLDYKQSKELNSLSELDEFLVQNYHWLHDKHLILRKGVAVNYGYAVVLKYKMIPNNSHPIKIYIDFQTTPFWTFDLPNPYRFENFVDDNLYKTYNLFIIEKKCGITK